MLITINNNIDFWTAITQKSISAKSYFIQWILSLVAKLKYAY